LAKGMYVLVSLVNMV